jgi:dynein heavy chain
LISSCTIDWYFSWPDNALLSVAEFKLEDVKLPEDHRQNIYKHIVKVHSSMQKYSDDFLAQLKRVNFSTPKNYLDFLNNYKAFLAEYKETF